MTTKEQLHKLVDELSEQEDEFALLVVERALAKAGSSTQAAEYVANAVPSQSIR